MNNKEKILVGAQKWARRSLDNAVLARYYQRYADIEPDTTFEDFISLVHESETSNVIDIHSRIRKDVNPAMEIEVLMNIMEKEYSKKRPVLDEERNYG